MATITPARNSPSITQTALTPADLLGSKNSGVMRVVSDTMSATTTFTASSSPDTIAVSGSVTPEDDENRSKYEIWHCPFKSNIHVPPTDVDSLPSTEIAFLVAAQVQIDRVKHIKNSFLSYKHAINDGQHHDFPADFLDVQNLAVSITIERLSEVETDLQRMYEEVAYWKRHSRHDDPVQRSVKMRLAQAKSWLDTMSELCTANHCFYKINYALAGDKPAIGESPSTDAA